MKYSELIRKCEELINSFNENIMTTGSHAEQFLSALKMEDTERVFLKQIFYGCDRYKGFIKTSNNVIFTLYSTSTNRKNDATLFSIFTYLICFRMDELPFSEFKKIVLSQDLVKMNVLLTFIFDIDLLREKVFEGWSQFLQMPYLEEKIVPALISRREKCGELIMKVTEGATGKKQQMMTETLQNIDQIGQNKKKLTVPQEFNLTKPKPKQLPMLEKIEVGFKAKPAPSQKKDLGTIYEEKKKRRQEIQSNIKKYYDENKKKDNFKFQTAKRPSNLPKIKQQVEKTEKKELKKKNVPRPMPRYEDVDVKLNVAAILRQQKKLNEKIEEEELRIKNLEMNMRDETEWEQWRKEMKEKDSFDKMQQQQRKKIQMQLAREAAVKAHEEKVQEKKNLVQDMKEIANELKIERENLESEMLQTKKKVIEQVQQQREQIVVQRQKVVEKNKKIAEQDKQERKRIIEKKKEQDKFQMQKKKELIAQIRQLEKKIKARPKQEIEYVSIGLFDEMTLDELKFKLMEVKKIQKEEEEKRRQENNRKKEDFKSTMNQKKTTIMAAREQLAKQKQSERKKKREEVQQEKKRLEEAKIKSMNEYKKKEQEKLKQKQREKEKLAKEIKETEQRRIFLMQGQAQQQANAFINLEKGEEREILDRQNDKLISEYKSQSIKQGQMKIIAEQNKKVVQSKIQFNKLYNEKQDFDNKMGETLQQEDQATKAMKYHEVRTFEQKHNENMNKSNAYKSKIAQMSLSKAKNKV